MDELSPEECRRLLDEEEVVHLGVSDDGVPYVTPLSYVHMDGAIVFRTLDGKRMRAIREHPEVGLEVSSYDPETGDWKSAVARGRAEVVEDEVAAGAFIAAMLRKYSVSFEQLFGVPGTSRMETAYVVRVDIQEVTGRSSGRFFGTKTRPGRL